jgi:hypothetical protein
MMLGLLRSLRTSSEPVSPQEDPSRLSLKTALEKLLKHLRQSELARSKISRRDTEGYISTFVKITPPTPSEIHTLKQMLAEMQAELSPGQLIQFQNESLLLFRQFVFAQDKVLVVFITEHFARSPSKRGNFHSHLTSKPDLYRHHHNGEQIGVPPGESNLEGGVLANPVPPAFRYYHLASNR